MQDQVREARDVLSSYENSLVGVTLKMVRQRSCRDAVMVGVASRCVTAWNTRPTQWSSNGCQRLCRGLGVNACA